MIEAHRISYLIKNGTIPFGKSVLHKCDNRKCVNPEHLFLGTQADNVYDCIMKGRARRGNSPTLGQDNVNAKLSNSVIYLIKKYRAKGWKLREIAGLCKVSESLISMILNGKRWKHLNRIEA